MPNSDWLPAVDITAGTVTLSVWAAGAGAALLLAGVYQAVVRAGTEALIRTVVRFGLVLVAALVGWAFLERLADRDRADERRALDQRMQELTTRATVPGSVLGCLDVSASETLQGACEKALFAGPDTIAAAMALVSARLSLLADAVDYAERVDSSYYASIAGLRRATETDAFGLVAEVLATRNGCTNAKCGQFALLSDATRVSANLQDGTFQALVTRYASGWPQPSRPGTPVASASAPAAAAPGPGNPVGINFPSAASIPPVSIMTSEPAAAPPPADAIAPANPPPAAPRRAGASRSTGRAPQSAPTAPPVPNAPATAAGPLPRAQ